MNEFFKNLLLRKKGTAPPSLQSSIGVTITRVGVVFVLLTDTKGRLVDDLVGSVHLANQHNARVIGMLGGLLQLLIHGESEQSVKNDCSCLAGEIMLLIQNRGITLWTVQECSIGCWGNEEWLNYGVIVPNFQHIMSMLGSANLGDCLKV